MRPTVTDRVAWSVGRSVGLSVTLVSPAKTAAPIDMPFGLRTRVGPRNRVLDGVPDAPMEWVMLMGERASHCKVYRHSAVICAKTTEPIEVLFELWAGMGCRNRALDGGLAVQRC